MGPIEVLYADDAILVVDKPAGMLVVPATGRSGPTVVDVVQSQVGGRVYAVHRLDEDTTGVLVLARTLDSKRALEEIFAAHRIERGYLALVCHAPDPPAGRIESRLQEGNDGVMRSVIRGGETAVTEYRTLARRQAGTLVECRLHTGRRNQIRVHMAELGCPVVGDRKYGWRPRRGERVARLLLHATRIAFDDPRTGAHVEVESLPPEEELRR
jgi:23S rRNA pseudouridine1911/1915/1917 synthase